MLVWYENFIRDWPETKRLNLVAQAFILGLIEFFLEVMLVIELLN